MAKLLSNTRVYGTATVDTQLFVNGNLSAHSAASGSLQVSGGIGVSGGGFFGGSVTATNFVGNVSGTANLATDLAGGTAGQLVYQIGPNNSGFAGPGTAGQILRSNGTSAPSYVNTTTFLIGIAKNLLGGSAGQFAYQTAAHTTNFISTGSMYVGRAVIADSLLNNAVSTATNLSGGTAGQVPYQSAPGITNFFGPGTAGQILTSNGAASPIYRNTSTIYVNSSVFAEDIRGGTAGQLVYQSAANTTAFAGPGTAGQVLTSGGTGAPVYINTSSLYVGRAVLADSATAGTSNQLVIGASTTNAAHYLAFVDSNNSPAAAETFYTNSAFVVNPSTGHVGINIASPGNRLHIYSSVGSLDVPDLIKLETYRGDFTGIGGGALVFKNQDGNNATNEARIKVVTENDGSIGLNNEGSSSFIFNMTNSGTAADRVIFRGDGLVGIGTNNPQRLLHIAGTTADTRFRISANDGTNYRGLEITAGTTFKGGMFYRTTEGNVMQIWGPNSSLGAIYIDANNVVDFNASASTHNTASGAVQIIGGLGVGGGGFFGGVVTATNFVGAVTGGASQVETQQSTAAASHYLIFVDSNNVAATAETVYTTASFVVNPGTGNVGIGIASPAYLLDVEGPINGNDLRTDRYIYDNGDTNTYIDLGLSDAARIVCGGVEMMRWVEATTDYTYTSYPLGIGNTAPTYQLDVTGTGSTLGRFVASAGTDALVRIIAANYATEFDARLFLGENDTAGLTIEYDGVANIGYIGMNSNVDPTGAWSKRIQMSRDGTETAFMAGNVGIGVAAPAYPLDVTGTARATADFRAPIFYDTNNTAYYTDPASTSVINNMNFAGIINSNSSSTRTKYRVYGSGSYAIGMQSGITFGGLNDWAMTFQFNNDDDRGFWWGDDAHTVGQGAMALNTRGWLTVAERIKVGGGQSDTADPSGDALQVVGTGSATVDFRAPIFYDSNNTAYYVNPAGTSEMLSIDMNNGDLTGVNALTFSDPGPNEGVNWGGGNLWKIYESPDDLTTNAGGNLQFVTNATWRFRIDTSGNAFSQTSMRAPIFYDSNNTAYYTDPAGLSNLNRIQLEGSGGGAAPSIYTNDTYVDVKYGSSGAGGIRLYDNDSALQGYWYASGGGEHGFLDNDGNWAVRIRTGTNAMLFYTDNNNEFQIATTYTLSPGSSRAPIFYDSNNTAFYTNPASTSILNSAQIASLGVGTAASGTAGEIRATNEITAYYSDSRLKTVKGVIKNALNKLKQLTGYYYTSNDEAGKYGYDTEKMQVGVLAQDVEKVLPEIVTRAPFDIEVDENGKEKSRSGNDYKTVRYEKLIPLLIEAIKEQNEKIEQLEQRIDRKLQ